MVRWKLVFAEVDDSHESSFAQVDDSQESQRYVMPVAFRSLLDARQEGVSRAVPAANMQRRHSWQAGDSDNWQAADTVGLSRADPRTTEEGAQCLPPQRWTTRSTLTREANPVTDKDPRGRVTYAQLSTQD
eukprot:132372-Amphidinium_carterae.1